LTALVGFAGCASDPAPVRTVVFATDIKPILEDRCVNCHNRATLPDRTSFESGELALEGDKQGPVIIPGNPNGSRMMVAVSAPDIHEQAMPPVSVRVSEKEAALFARWIEEGAYWPDGPEGRLQPTEIPKE